MTPLTLKRNHRCARCGRTIQPWHGVRYPACANCIVTPELQDDLLELRRQFPRLSVKRIAADLGLGVSVAVVYRWLRAAMRRRGMLA